MRLAEACASPLRLKLSTISRRAANQGQLLDRLRDGADITTRRAARIVQWFSDHWPTKATWPADIPRPTPAPPPGDPVEVVRGLREQRLDLTDPKQHDRVNWDAVQNVTLLMMVTATQLDAKGHISSPKALCLALGVDRDVYDKTVYRYAGQGGKRPAAGSDTERVLDALVDAGDVRFSGRRAA